MEQEQILRRYLAGIHSKEHSSQHTARDFLKLKRQSTKYKTERTYSTAVAEKPENIKKNRYKDILPFDHSRVELSLITSDNDSDYINANFIKGVYGPRGYIATQGPLAHTVLDFWRLIWEYNVLIVVMACMEFEMGKKKCERYWPDVGQKAFECGPFSITCEAETNKAEYVIRTLKVKLYNNTRPVYHFHYKHWPDHDVPSSTEAILGMIATVRQYQEDDSSPVCVHCSAGCGRTGVLCAIDYTGKMLKDGIIPENFSIYSLIQEMRTQRALLVQTKEQYELVCNAISQLFKRQLDKIAAGCENPPNHPRTDPFPIPVTSPGRMVPLNSFLEEKKKNHQDGHVGQGKMSSCVFSSLTLDNSLEKPKPEKAFCPFGQSPPCRTLELKSYNSGDSAAAKHWEDVSLFAGRPLQKHHSIDFDSIYSKNLHPSPPFMSADGRSYQKKPPLTRAKSSPFESTQCKEVNNLGQKSTALPFSFQLSNLHESGKLNIQEHMSSFSMEWNNVGREACTIPCQVNCGPSSDLYIRLTEDPYFSTTSSSDLGSPEITDICEVSTSSESRKDPVLGGVLGLVTPVSSPVASPKSYSLDLNLSEPSITAAQAGNTEASIKTSPDPDEERPPPLPERTAESYIVASEAESRPPTSQAQPPRMNVKIMRSLEWNGTSHDWSLADSVKSMARSKSVKVRSSRLEHSRDRSPSPPPLPERTRESLMIAGEEDVMQMQPEERSAAAASFPGQGLPEESTPRSPLDPVKWLNRSKSLKILRNVKKTLCPGPALTKAAEAPQSGHSGSLLKFGFGNRFCRPRGPRSPPPAWDV
ncbi:tyrosine-protein phosphatase non-receptor type 22 [Rhinatrema bivittatum]|uniref:tyrosine-protein phosphatase non-receptor type 22 n=1 Tax=Rhinatrema bivittatum TaxID=194408 RepID=UPI00112C633B|nr:tyrosine-protein phosphatase non-receptor type 22 [Rhinatrema bivittatum]